MTSAAAAATALKPLDVDAVVIGTAAGDDGPVALGGVAELDAALGGRLARVLADVGATGRAGEVVRFATLGAIQAGSVVAVGVGPLPAGGGPVEHEALRRAAGAATRALAGTARVATTLALAGGAATPEATRAVAEGSLLGAYSFDAFRTTSAKGRPAPVEQVVVLVDEADLATAADAVEHAVVVADAVRLVRDLVNTPPGHLPPARLAEIAEQEGGAVGLLVEVLDEKELADGGYGGLLGVGQGSVNPPRLVRLEWPGTAAADGEAGEPALALVGKGITFDSGGLSLKPPASMEWMKTDMAGAAAVLATMVAAARLRLPARVVGWLACAENMPSGTAIRPSDVLTLRGGTRVEVLNTDAEGRLVLGDALVRAMEESPAMIVDVATLTGAQIVALGQRTAGLLGRDAAVDAVATAAKATGEAVWPMPMPPELRKVLDSTVADLANVPTNGSRDGGMIVAGHFLAAFVPDGVAWAHLDIAGPSWNGGEPYGHTPKAGTGVITRTLIQLAEDRASA
ncbi:leucyl aminopeptidase [Frankia nepalensis]|uniref:Probable cytosol aminopeptidase n=1 Tax=Frankia nepalensis TaxID=1836974 RepID=A0A937UWP1_9ACTN|nr:leucyl aminopeptidase [Frankia nepalensis]MBL7500690.1 leucyl aminopeptidase [Frankia nepalensis]MBL7513124.1 leucyl aminopeptidase [Frankia nepalensis]MBL7633601.1 leucyl aminopeptidase [Frankia nepalensis]